MTCARQRPPEVTMRISTAISLGLAALAVAGCSSTSVSAPDEPVVVASSNAAIVGRFTVEVDPTAERPDDRMRITYRALKDVHRSVGDDLSVIGQGASSVLTSATLS